MNDVLLGMLLLTGLTIGLTSLVVVARNVLSPRKPATLSVSGFKEVATETGVRLLSALNDNGILIPSACAGAGTCGLCRVKVIEGVGPALPTETALLTKSELREGIHLACQVVIRNDLGVEVPAELLGATSFVCTVEETRPLTPLIREIVLRLPDDAHPEIVAGSYVQLTAPAFSRSYSEYAIPEAHERDWTSIRSLSVASAEPVSRAYSLANRPEDTDLSKLVLNIRLALPPPSVVGVPPGIVSSWLFGLTPGEKVEASGPFGTFRVQDTDAEMVVIGGGVGMAPLRAIIHEQLIKRRTARKISFWYGARSLAELYYAEEFSQLASTHPNFTWTVVLSDPDPTDAWSGAIGFVHSVAFERHLRDHPAPESCEYYLCGPPLMMRAVRGMLDDLGVDDSQIFADDFGV
jgi:Na+-transporting NADH:ubiquinone oxidoreductase subunit F